MTGSNLPPGVSESMIPGNRPEDIAEEEFWENLESELQERYKLDVEDEYWDADWFRTTVLMARELGEKYGFHEGMAEQATAEFSKREDAWLKQRCAVCGEQFGADYARAEVVLIDLKYLSERPHLIVHAETCFNSETMELA
jgi:hypothetical protein